MSESSVDLVREAIRAFNDRDTDWLAAHSVEDFVWSPAIAGGVDGRVYRGETELREFFAELDDVWDEFEIEPGEFRDLGDHVLVFTHVRAKGKTGIEFDQFMGGLYEVRGGKFVSGRSYLSREECLRAAAEASGREVAA